MPKFMPRLAFLLAIATAFGGASTTAMSAEEAMGPENREWSFDGPFGLFDRAALQRGFHVYKDICAACHTLDLVAFRNLGDPGGPGFTEAEVRALAASYMVPAEPDERGRTTDADGRPLMREAIPADYYPSRFANDNAQRAANNGSLPPDLSLIVKARDGGADYLYALLTGYGHDAPADITVPPGQYYNPYFAGGLIAMPQPLFANQVVYADGTPATIEQMASDVTYFLAWTAEPKMEERKRMGFAVMLFLVGFAGLCYASYRRLWHDAH
jgi:cytochrome c1